MGRVCDRQGMKSEKNDRFAELRKLRQSRKDKKSSPQKNARTKPSTSVELKSNSEDEEDDNDQNTSKKNTSKRGNSSISFSSPSKNVNDFTKGYSRYNADSFDPLSESGSDDDFVVEDDVVEYESNAGGSDSDSENNNKNSETSVKATTARERSIQVEYSSDESEFADAPQLKKKRCGKIVLEDSDDSQPTKKTSEASETEDSEAEDKYFPSDDDIADVLNTGNITPEEAKRTRLAKKKHSSSSSDWTSSSDSDDLYQRPDEDGKRVSVRARKLAVQKLTATEKSFERLKKQVEEKKRRPNNLI